jgi:hypothetical protein
VVTTSRGAWLVWGTGAAVDVVAILHRTSLGVSGLGAVHRFGASAGMLATLVVLQLAVYAALQVPVGVAIDHIGPRRLIVAGALTIAAGPVTGSGSGRTVAGAQPARPRPAG